MQINADLSTDAMALGLLQKRADASGSSNPNSAAIQTGPTPGQPDPLLPRLTETPSSVQNSDLEIQDGSEASTIMNSLLQSMSGHPGMAMAAHANQLPGNVLSLLQSND